ncbi:hypothetical protein [Halomonas sp. TD01]|uniref:hypothetical protein n=1 Tax=Halomonas sp. TD01 TaxID=999141 RepID=UPI000214DE75|nr:hypothetical protein [Halomonas sp. TD01]EGP21220.1 hypothetical protein GME_02715 [Halomonas sp. TD01]CAH1043976.1 hypothetical protein HPTD01_2454 [Halomonas sp. TD01]
MEKDLVIRAHAAFNEGDYIAAKKLYQKAAKLYGETLFSVNVVLCDKYLQVASGKEKSTINSLIESAEVKKLHEQMRDMQRQLREKDANINERFKELAILTRILEEKDNTVSA